MAAPLKWLSLFGVVVIFVLISSISSRYMEREHRTKILRLQFVVIVQTLILVGGNFIWKQLVSRLSHEDESTSRNNGRGSGGSRMSLEAAFTFQLWRAFVLLFLILTQLSYILGMTIVQDEPHWIVMISFCCLGTFIILVSILIPVVVMETGIAFIQKRIWRNQSIRFRVNPYMKVILVTSLVTVLALVGINTAHEGPWAKHVEIPVYRLPKSMDGLKIAQLSDIHLGPTVGRSHMKKAVDIASDWQADLIVITGDLVDATVEKLRGAVEPLSELKAKYGVYFITGNHEYYTGNVDKWFVHLKTLGVDSLHNQNVKIVNKENPNDWFYLAGTDDLHAERISYTGHGMRLDEALADTDKDRAVILLAHQPKAAKIALNSDHNISVVLSGHTHAGQILPLILGAYLINPYYAGLYQHSVHSYVYVSSGTYYWGFPMRLATTPEITYITLRVQY